MAIKFLSGQTIDGTLTVSGNVQGATFNGLAINTTGTNNLANQIVRTQANGYANFGWINSVSGNHTGAITRITASGDAYLRYVTPAQFRTGVTDGFYAPFSTVTGVTSVTGTGTVSGITLTGTVTSTGDLTLGGTLSASITNISDAARWWNNFGDNHSTRTGFDASTASYGFGWRYVQGNTNGPGTGGAQFYSAYVGLGNEYPSTGTGSYGAYLAFDRNVTNPYLSIRYNEGNVLGTWKRISAGTADILTTARTIAGVSFNGSANISLNNNAITNGAGYITSASLPSVGNGQIDGRTSGLGISGSMDATANQTGNTTFTVTSNAVEAATASTLVYRDAGADINVRLLRANYTDQGTISGAIAYRINNSSNNYTRYCSDTGAIRTFLGVPASGDLSNYLPLAGGIMSGNIGRSAHNVGFQVGGYNNLGASDTYSNPIFAIGTSYMPSTTTLSDMYGIGYTNSSASFISFTGASSWGMYVAANGVARVWLGGNNGAVSTNGAMYSPIYYDTNTAYYGDFASTSVLNAASFAGVIDANGGHGGINITNTSILSSATSTWTGNPGGAGKLQYHSNRWYIVSDSSSNRIVQFRQDANDKSYIANDGRFMGIGATATSSFISPIYYDTNTAYYGDFASQSSMYGVAVRGDLSNTATGNQIFFWGSGNSTTSAIGFKANGGNFVNPTGNGDGYNTYLTMDTNGRGWVFRRGTGGTNFTSAYTAGWILNNGIFQANASMRAPIFYDSNNTAYFGDFGGAYSNITKLKISANWGTASGVSPDDAQIQIRGTYPSMTFRSTNSNKMWLRHMDAAGEIQHYGAIGTDSTSWSIKHTMKQSGTFESQSSLRAPIFYDLNNTAYYGDFASTSQLNVLNCAGTLTVTGAGGVVAPKFTDYNNGAFYLDPASTGTSLNVAGDVVAYASSDIRFKNNVVPITNALDKINKIGGYTFEWNEKSHKKTGKKDIGVIAQEVEEILPEIVDTRDNGYKAVDYSKLTALLIQSVKEQQVIINDLKTRIETLENN